MEFTSYGLNAYKRESENNGKKKTESVSSQIRKTAEPGHVPLVHKPVFEKINRIIDENERQDKKRLEEESLRQAQIAAKSGTWFSKKKAATSEDVKIAADKLTSGGLIMIPGGTSEAGEDSIYRRVAKFLVLIGIDEAAKILPHLTDEQTEKIIPEIATIQKIEPDEARLILQEFDSLVLKAREEGGVDTARAILSKAYGSQKAEDILSRVSTYTNQVKPFGYLDDANPERIKILIEGESVAVQTLVLSQIEPAKAAKIINLFDVEQKKNVILRLAKMRTVAPEIIVEIDKSLHEKMLTQNTENSQNLDGRGVLAQILKRMDPGTENSILNSLSQDNPELGEDLRKRLFTEEDVIGSDDRFIQNWLHNNEERDIAILIHGKSLAFREKILSNVSKNRAQMIIDEESFMEHIAKSEVDKMTSLFYSVLRRAWERGELMVSGREDGEIYV